MGMLSGRRAVVTGAASGIGAATARLLAGAGAAIVAVDLDGGGAEAVAATIRAAGGAAEAMTGDVTLAADCRGAVDRSVASFGGLEILVNCAGIIRRADIVETSEAEWDRVMAVNVKSVFLMSQAAVPHLAGAPGAAIVNIGSGWGLKGGPRAASYCASKGAVVNLTRAMAIDHGPQGIRVNCVCPGDTDTPMLRAEARQLGEDEATFLASSAERPLARLGTPDDIAQAVVYLVSEAAQWVTGTTLVVDGGGLA
ncbi:MAG: glucose 1-dehydrogenase [Chloroflexota bacterium]|nr:MAG: glucose 1-dehydrogenase [Chloroflexota bacterium]